MRAAFVTKSICQSNGRYYSKNLLGRIVNYVNTWTEQFDRYAAAITPAAPDQQMQSQMTQLHLPHPPCNIAVCPSEQFEMNPKHLDDIECSPNALLVLRMLALYLQNIRSIFVKDDFDTHQEHSMELLRNKGDEHQELLEDAGREKMNWLLDRWLCHRGPLVVRMCDLKYLLAQCELEESQLQNVFDTLPHKSWDTLEQLSSEYVMDIVQNNDKCNIYENHSIPLPLFFGFLFTLLSNCKLFWNLINLSIDNQNSNTLPSHRRGSHRNMSTDGGNDNKSPTKQKLLKYPVQPLKETLQHFLLTAEPLLTPKEFEQQKKITQEFETNEGAKLQTLLEEAGKLETNWLAHRWLTNAYLKYRNPVTVYVSPGMTFPYHKFKDMREFLNYTAKVIYGLGEFKAMVDAGKIPVVKMGKNELDNSQFGKVFGTCRIPIRGTDCLLYNPSSNYFVVICKNHFYKLSLYDGEGELLSSATMAKQLEEVLNAESTPGIPFGVLTSSPRDTWADVYKQFVERPENAETVNIIQDALFTVSLDECVSLKPGQQANELILGLIHGHGSKVNSGNRWMDKTIQLVVNPNGNVGFTYEHSPAEGQPIAMMMDYVVKKLAADENFGKCGSTKLESGPQKLNFAPLNYHIGQSICDASHNIDKLVKDLHCHVMKFPCFGKNYIKKQKLGPDSFVQMAFQLAFYKMHKLPAAQYESAHLRIFENGRTETIRSCSNESVAFCRAMVDPKASTEAKICLMRQAVEGHQKYARSALLGKAIDRHLLGLKLMAEENKLPIPEFFSSPGYVKSLHFRVSTSQVASAYEAFMGYGPATDDGYAACYNPRGDDIIVAITCWRYNQDTDADKFAKAVEGALLDMQTVLENGKKAKGKL